MTGESTTRSGAVGPADSIPPRADEPLLRPGDTIGDLEVRELIGRGGQADVYLAWEQTAARYVALKAYQVVGPEATERAVREARTVSMLGRHPGIMPIWRMGPARVREHDLMYWTMPYVEAAQPGLVDQCEAKNLSRLERLRLFIGVCGAVQYAHSCGIIHRDLKPSNILVTEMADKKLRAVVSDFGIAWRDEHLELCAAPAPGRTHPGTLRYMSPEQRDGGKIDRRADVYSLGVILHELLTGRLPFEWDLLKDRPRTASIDGSPLLNLDNSLHADLRALIARALAPNAHKRLKSAAALANGVRAVLRGEMPATAVENRGWRPLTPVTRWIPTHPRQAVVIAILACTAATVLVVDAVIGPAMFKWTPVSAVWGRTMARIPGVGGFARWKDSVLVVSVNSPIDDGSVADIAARRKLIADVLERCAEVRPRAVMIDLEFLSRPAATEMTEIVTQLERLRDLKVPVIGATSTWKRDKDGRPDIDPRILNLVGWGGVTGWFEPDTPWQLDFAVKRAGYPDAFPSLTAATIGAALHKDARIEAHIIPEERVVELRFTRSSPGIPDARTEAGPPLRIPLTDAWEDDGNDADKGLEAGDLVGSYWLAMPDDAALKKVTIAAGDLVKLPDAQASSTLASKVVVIGDINAAHDEHVFPGGRRISGVYTHAVGVGMALTGSFVRTIPPTAHYAVAGGIALAGSIIGYRTGRRRGRWIGPVACWIVAAAAAGAAGVAAYVAAGWFIDPWDAVIGMAVAIIAAWLMGVFVDRVSRSAVL